MRNQRSEDPTLLSPLHAPKRPLSQLGWAAGWFLAIAAATAGGLWWWDGSARQDSPEELVDELRVERLLPARLSRGYYARYGSTVERDAAFRRRLDQARDRARYRSSPATWSSLRSEAWLSLAGDPDERWKALLSLEAAIASYPRSAEVWSDLAAVRYSLALEQDEPSALLPALDAAERALEIDPNQLDALFNRALCLQELGIWRAAKETWENYLEEDSSSGWADEARRYLLKIALPNPDDWPHETLEAAARSGDQAAVRTLVEQYRSPSRRWLEEKILPGWGGAVLRGESAEDRLQAARTIAAAYAELSGDTLYRQAVEVLVGAAGARRLELAAAHQKFGEAVEAVDRYEAVARAKALLEAASSGWGESPFAWRAELKKAVVAARELDHEDVLDLLRRLRENLRVQSPNLLGEAYWLEGTTYKYQNQLVEAADAYGRAWSQFESAGEIDPKAGIENLQAELLAALGQYGEVWRRLQGPLTETARIHQAKRLYDIYSAAAISAGTAGYPRVGLLFQRELEPVLEANPTYSVDSALWRARFLHVLGREAQAYDQLTEARTRLSSVPEGTSRQGLEAEIRSVEGDLEAVANPAAAVVSFEETLDFYRKRGKRVLEKSAWLQLGRAYRRLGNASAARRAWQESVGLTEKERSQLEEEDRSALLDNDRESFAELTSLEFDSGDPLQALDWSERRRGRTLLDRMADSTGGEGAPVLSIEEIRQQLPRDLTVIEYAAVGGRWVAWVITSQGVRGVDLRQRERDLARRVQRWSADIQLEVHWSSLQPEAMALYRDLIRPLNLPAGGDWVIATDGALKDLPFAALFDGQSFLIEQHGISMAPSANLWLRARQRNRSLPAPGSAPLPALVLGNPAPDPEDRTPPLPHAESEAIEVAGFYRVSPFLQGAATRALFLTKAAASEIIQVSGHARTRPESPLDSALLLAGKNLTLREIQDLHLDRTRLVVLSACGTASGPSRGGEGAESLARAFLAAGVPGVVATLWDVRDRSTSELVTEFHRQLRRTGDARQALRQAQLSFVKSERPVAAWAAFQLIGEASMSKSGGSHPTTGGNAK